MFFLVVGNGNIGSIFGHSWFLSRVLPGRIAASLAGFHNIGRYTLTQTGVSKQSPFKLDSAVEETPILLTARQSDLNRRILFHF
jgi:hypothetical protein